MIDIQDPQCDVKEIWSQYFKKRMKETKERRRERVVLQNKEREDYTPICLVGTQIKFCLAFTELDVYNYIKEINYDKVYNYDQDQRCYLLAQALVKIWVEAKLIEFYYNRASDNIPMYVSKEAV